MPIPLSSSSQAYAMPNSKMAEAIRTALTRLAWLRLDRSVPKSCLRLACHTGMRRGEIMNLTWDMADMENARS